MHISGESNGYCAEYGGEFFDSQTEAAWAAYFDALNIKWIREPETFEFPRTNLQINGHCFNSSPTIYTPDFLLPDLDLYVEVKNGNAAGESYKLRKLARFTGKNTAIFDGKPHNAALYFYSPGESLGAGLENRHNADVWAPNFKWISGTDPDSPFKALILKALSAAENSWTTDVDPDLESASKKRKRQLFISRTVFNND